MPSPPPDASQRLRLERRAIADHLAILDASMRDVVESAGSTTGDDEHDPEGSTIAFERAQVSALRQQARQRLAEVDAASARLDAGTYGMCGRCGLEIGAERLAARPGAAYCVRCAGAR
ncbi:MAG: molecular chaperone DnaK [Pseudonocardiales bacterium]|nr:molecular chaperone DnaK [Pseudonocardiales bacterium]